MQNKKDVELKIRPASMMEKFGSTRTVDVRFEGKVIETLTVSKNTLKDIQPDFYRNIVQKLKDANIEVNTLRFMHENCLIIDTYNVSKPDSFNRRDRTISYDVKAVSEGKLEYVADAKHYKTYVYDSEKRLTFYGTGCKDAEGKITFDAIVITLYQNEYEKPIFVSLNSEGQLDIEGKKFDIDKGKALTILSINPKNEDEVKDIARDIHEAEKVERENDYDAYTALLEAIYGDDVEPVDNLED